MEPTEIRVVPTAVEVREREKTGRVIIGLAAPYGEVTDLGAYTEEFAPGVFKKSTSEAARSLPLMAFHDHDSIPVGKAVGWEETADGLVGTWQVDTRAEAMEMARLAEEQLMDKLSVGFVALRDGWGERDGRKHVVRKEARLLEVSLVPVAQYDTTRVIAVRSKGVPGMPGTAVFPKPNLSLWESWFARVKADG